MSATTGAALFSSSRADVLSIMPSGKSGSPGCVRSKALSLGRSSYPNAREGIRSRTTNSIRIARRVFITKPSLLGNNELPGREDVQASIDRIGRLGLTWAPFVSKLEGVKCLNSKYHTRIDKGCQPWSPNALPPVRASLPIDLSACFSRLVATPEIRRILI